MPRKKLGEMLVEAGVLSESGLRMALGEQKRWGGTLGRTVVEMKLVSEAELVRVLAQQLNLPTVDLDTRDIHKTVLDLVPGEVAEEHTLIPFAQPMKFLDVAMAEPMNAGVVDELRIRTQLNIRPYLAGPKMIERAIGKFYGRGFSKHSARPAVPPDVPMAIDDVAPRRRDIAPPPVKVVAQDGLRPFPNVPRTETPDFAGPPPIVTRDAEIDALQERLSALEALVARDEEVLRKLLALLVEKKVATREEILERIR
jgi:type IV pilus assembly protein PilB